MGRRDYYHCVIFLYYPACLLARIRVRQESSREISFMGEKEERRGKEVLRRLSRYIISRYVYVCMQVRRYLVVVLESLRCLETE